MCVNNLSKVALDSAAAGIEPAISSRKSNAITTTPPSHRRMFNTKWQQCSSYWRFNLEVRSKALIRFIDDSVSVVAFFFGLPCMSGARESSSECDVV